MTSAFFLSHSKYIVGQAAFMYFVDLYKKKKKKLPERRTFGPTGCGMSYCFRNRWRGFDMILSGFYEISHKICNTVMLCNM